MGLVAVVADVGGLCRLREVAAVSFGWRRRRIVVVLVGIVVSAGGKVAAVFVLE